MDATTPRDSLPDVGWGLVAGVAGGMAVAWLTARGVSGLVHLATREVHERLLDGSWVPRRG